MPKHSRRSERQGGIAIILLSLMLLTVLLPMLGLGIDLAMMYGVKSRLGAAMDGAVLATGRSINAAQSLSAQSGQLTQIAQQFLSANFPAGYWGSSGAILDGPVTLDNSQAWRIKIGMSAHCSVPLMFARIFNQDTAVAAATSQAARRSLRLVLVLDQSSSMAGTPISDLKVAAKDFILNGLTASDALGLVGYGGSAVVAYPPRNPDNPAAGSGPDLLWSLNSMNAIIDTMQAGGNTSTAEALVMAERELQKNWANYQLYLNVIVLFTDGMPNGITAGFNGSSPSAMYPGEVYSAGSASVIRQNPPNNPASPCVNKVWVAPNPTQIVGWMAQGAGYANVNTNGSVKLAYQSATITRHTTPDSADVAYWLSNPSSLVLPGTLAANPARGCTFNTLLNSSREHPERGYLDITSYPTEDIYGNKLNPPGLAYQRSANYIQEGSAINMNAITNAYQFGLVAWNAADQAAKRIRRDPNTHPMIMTIGYHGGDDIDRGLLKRIANTHYLSDFDDPNKPAPTTGAYYPADWDGTTTSGRYFDASPGNIKAAFQQVESELLRLSQ